MLRAFILLAMLASPLFAEDGVSTSYSDEFNPWFPNKDFPALVTPSWVGEDGVEAVIVLSIDDMRDSAKYEQYLRPILNRLKQIDGRAPVSIMTCDAKPDDPQLQSWLEEGLSIEVHTADHPCPLLNGGDIASAKSTVGRCVDQLSKIPGSRPVAFRTPCCDSLNTVSPRFFSEIISKTTDAGNYLQMDSSVFNFFTSADESIPRELVFDKDGNERFEKYRPRNNNYGGVTHDHFVNYIENYPYPYIINDTCWQLPCAAPSDWSAQHLHGVDNPITIDDWETAIDITVHKKGVFSLVFHPHGWIKAEGVVELIDRVVAKHGTKIKFLTFRDVAERLNRSLSNGKSLRETDQATRDALSHETYREENVVNTDYRSLPQTLRTKIEAGEFPQLPQLNREDGTFNGYFVRDQHLCWQNEDTNKLPDLIHRIPIADLLKDDRRKAAREALPPIPIGAAVVDITPSHPVRLTGYGNRATESEGVAARIHARALAIGGPLPGSKTTQPLSVLVTVDNCGVPASMTEAVFAKVAAQHGLDRARFAISSTHTHAGPWLRDFAPNVLVGLPEEHAANLARYEKQLTEQIVDVVAKAVKSRRPGRLSTATGSAGFAMNRRAMADGRWKGFGETKDGPVDNQLPILAARDTHGELIAVLANYACHATTETGEFNQISGDWPGFAADMLEVDHPNAVALVAIGCGADANPSPRGTHEQARQHGQTFAAEVNRLLRSTELIDTTIDCRIQRIDLPLGPLPSREAWEQQAKKLNHAGHLAKRFLKLQDEGKTVPTSVPNYPVQTWCFGDDLAMVFLAGEVVVDYSIRLNDMFDSDRLWINAYTNDVPCYIVSKRILREGGYEADSSMIYYAHPTRLAPQAEDVICDAVQKILPHSFYSEKTQVLFPAPKTPQESLACITTKGNLKVELVAAEPLINDPVAFDWDAQGRLWVVEMGDYPGATAAKRQPNVPGGGRVRVLEDTNADGQYDKATTFLDGLPFPNGISLWRNGIVITAAPDVIYAEDTNGDLKADVRKILYTGFVEGNQQHRVNGLRWGLDGWLHVANGDSGGEVKTTAGVIDVTEQAAMDAVNIRGRDLRIQPDFGGLTALSGQTQFGRERDDFGNWFGSNNSNPIFHYVLPDSYLARNPHATAAQTKCQVSESPGAAKVYPTSKTQARFNEFASANRFTSACSTSLYRDNYLGEEYYGNAFTCEPVHNMVSRLVMERKDATFHGRRADDEKESEFFASTDNWSRPVMVRTGPDGALYIADMYRQVVEHPEWIPEEYQRKMNLQAGSDKGRIYRLVPAGECCQPITNITADTKQAAVAQKTPMPDANLRDWFTAAPNEISTEDLVSRMASPNGWWRDTAQRLLQHQVNSGEIKDLAQLAASDSSPAVQVQAMHALLNMQKSTDINLLTAALENEAPEVRRHALKLLEPSLQQVEFTLPEALKTMVNDPSLAVRQQLALSVGMSEQPAAAEILAALLRNNSASSHIVDAAMTSLTTNNIGGVLRSVFKDAQTPTAITTQLINQAAARKNTDALKAPIAAILKRLKQSVEQNAANWTAATQAIQSLKRQKAFNAVVDADADTAELFAVVRKDAIQQAVDNTTVNPVRIACLNFHAAGGHMETKVARQLIELLNPTSPIDLQQAVVNAVAKGSSEVAAEFFDNWNSVTPAVRSTVIEHSMRSTAAISRMLDAIAAEKLTAADIGASAREQLLNHRDADIKAAAKTVLGMQSTTARSTVVADYHEKLASLSGEAARGKIVFEKRCATCHRLQNIGKAVGADLAAVKDRSFGAMLTAILDPNKAVETKFLSYTAITTEGLAHNGMLVSETGNSITLVGTDGKERVVARPDLDELICSNRSLMPEGLEKDLSPQDLADVISFVQSAGTKWKLFDGNAPAIVKPNNDGTIRLSAATAEIYGPQIIFEDKHKNLGWWSTNDDYAVWTLDIPRTGLWTVEFEYACDNSAAGNALKMSTGARLFTATVPGTGTWDDYRTWSAGEIDLGQGRRRLTVTAPEELNIALIDLRAIRLIPPK